MRRFLRTPAIALVSVLLLPLTADAQFFRIDELIGPAPQYGSGTTIEFDLGREFTEVREVVLLIEAIVTPLTVISCGSISNPEPCTERLLHVGFFARIDDPDAGFLSAEVEGFRSDRAVRNAGAFNQVFLDFDYASLRDGKGELTLYWNAPLFTTGASSRRDLLPSGEILDAVLVVDGTPARKLKPRRRWWRNPKRW